MTDRLYLRTRDLAQAGGLFIHDFSWTDVEAGVDGKGWVAPRGRPSGRLSGGQRRRETVCPILILSKYEPRPERPSSCQARVSGVG